VTTEANGKIIVLGLEQGDYYLKEVKAPDGYNKLQDSASVDVGTKTHQFSVVVDQNGNVVDSEFAEGTNVKHTYICTTTTVENSKGTMLPSTGGEGTKMLLMIGFVTAMIFAVLLITHKKMTVYQD
jgi:LPXTG-motif cell wall-anchored protein